MAETQIAISEAESKATQAAENTAEALATTAQLTALKATADQTPAAQAH